MGENHDFRSKSGSGALYTHKGKPIGKILHFRPTSASHISNLRKKIENRFSISLKHYVDMVRAIFLGRRVPHARVLLFPIFFRSCNSKLQYPLSLQRVSFVK